MMDRYSVWKNTETYFHHVEVINDLVELFQMYSTHIYYHPESAAEYRSKQTEQALHYEKIIRNNDIVLQMDQVACIHKGLPQVASPRYTPTQDELENDNIRFILQSPHGDADVADKEMQIIHKEFMNERDSRNNCPDSHFRLWNIDDLTDMGFNLTRFSPILTIGDTVPQTPVGSGTTTPVPTSTPRPNGRSQLHNSDLIPNREHTHAEKLYNSFTGILGQVEPQNPTGPRPKLSGTDKSTPTFNTRKFYLGVIPFRNQGTNTSPPQCVETVETQNTPVNTTRGTSGTQTNPPSVTNTQNGTHTTRNLPQQPNTGKGGKNKSS